MKRARGPRENAPPVNEINVRNCTSHNGLTEGQFLNAMLSTRAKLFTTPIVNREDQCEAAHTGEAAVCCQPKQD